MLRNILQYRAFHKLLVVAVMTGALSLIALACSAAEETTTAAPVATTAPVQSTTSTTAAEATATPTPQYDTTLYGATGLGSGRTQEEGAQKLQTRPVITKDIIERMPLMSIEEVAQYIPISWDRSYRYEEIRRGGTFINAVNWDVSKWDPRMTAAGGTAVVSNLSLIHI